MPPLPRICSAARLLLLCLLLPMLAGLDSCAGTDAGTPATGRTPGVSEKTIRLGSSLVLTGHARYLGVETLRGALAYINHVNETGGVHGRRIELDARDDGYDPPRCLANTQELLISGDVFALTCYVGTPTTMRILPLVNEARIPLVGAFTGANGLRDPFSRYIFNVRASYYQETAAAVRHLVNDLGLTRIAVFYQYDAYGFDGLTGTELALLDMGLAPVARGSYARGTNNVEEGLHRILASDAEAVVMVGTYEPTARFIRMAQEAGLDAVYHALSFTGAEELARLLGDTRARVLLSQVVPPPDAAEAPAILGCTKEYVNLLRRYYPEATPNAIGLEGYINARILVEGLRRAGPDLTREGFVRALESLRDYPLGGRTNVSFSPESRQGMGSVYFTRLAQGRFELMREAGAPHPGGKPAAPARHPAPANREVHR